MFFNKKVFLGLILKISRGILFEQRLNSSVGRATGC